MNFSAPFQGYLKDFEGARAEALAAIDEYAKSSSREEREARVVAARSSVDEVERYWRVLDSEAKSGSTPSAKRKMMEQVRRCQTQVSTLTATLNKELLVADARAGASNATAKDADPKQQMERCADRLDRTGRHLDEAQRTLANTESIAGNVRNNLAQQRAQLEHVEMNVEETREDTEEARGHLKQLACKVFSSRVLLVVVIVALAAAIVLVSYYKWYPQDNNVQSDTTNTTSSSA